MTPRQDNRDALLEAIAGSAVELLRYHDLDRSLPCILEKLGTATGADRMQLMQYETTPAGAFRVVAHHGWCAPGIERSVLDGWVEGKTMEENGFRPWGARLCRGEIIAGPAASFKPPIRAFLERDGVRSVVIVPVFVKGEWWGAIGFDDCTSTRTWSSAEIDALRTLAELVGTAVQQARDVARLKNAHRIIGNSPTILFRLGGEYPYPLRYVSPNIERYGYTAAQLLAAPKRWPDLVDSEDLPGLMRAIRSIADDGAGEAEAEFRFIRPDGARVWFDGHATPLPRRRRGAGRHRGAHHRRDRA